MSRDTRALVQHAIDAPRLTLNDLSAVVGKSRASMEAYREGRVEIPAEARLRLAQFLEAHARRLQGIAAELRVG